MIVARRRQPDRPPCRNPIRRWVLLATVCLPVMAGAGGIAASVKIGTLGPGLDLVAGLNPNLSLRGGITGFAFNRTVSMDDADVDGRVRWQTAPLLLDWFPIGEGFRFSGGLVLNHNRVTLTATPNETLELSGTEYIIERLDGRIDFNRAAPYIGIGYGNPGGSDRRWHVACDFGVMFQGRPRVSAQAVAAHPDLQDYVDRDLQAEVQTLRDDLRSFQFYPVISVGVSLRF